MDISDTTSYTFRLPTSLHKRVRVLAALENVPMSEWLRGVVEEAAAIHERADAIYEAGLTEGGPVGQAGVGGTGSPILGATSDPKIPPSVSSASSGAVSIQSSDTAAPDTSGFSEEDREAFEAARAAIAAGDADALAQQLLAAAGPLVDEMVKTLPELDAPEKTEVAGSSPAPRHAGSSTAGPADGRATGEEKGGGMDSALSRPFQPDFKKGKKK